MRYSEIKLTQQQLNEVRMSLASLRQQVAGINALSGMEFEMVVPGVKTDDYEPEYEPDYDKDERPQDIDDIITFFSNGEYGMSYSRAKDLGRTLERQFEEWLGEKMQEEWDNNASRYIADYIDANYSEEERNSEDFDEGAAADDAHDQFRDDFNLDQFEWLTDIGWTTMQDVANALDLEWPYVRQVESEGNSIEDVAEDFRRAIGRPVHWDYEYHGAKRDSKSYSVEPDGSIQHRRNEGGLEFVSPPLPLSEMIRDLHRVREWAGMYGCYTNKSTGLHINVSVPGYSLERLDFVKLALLIGDDYVLQQFGRSANTYCKSALGIVKSKILSNPADAAYMLNQMKGHMSALASKAIHSGNTDKYTSINTNSGYIEFRSPGGDWLDENFERIEATLLRFVVALDAAMDPQKYRQEYLKKLYKLLSVQQVNDPVAYFSRYVTGDMTKADLKNMIQSLQTEREIQKAPPGTVNKYVWRVTSTTNSSSMDVVANTREDAINVARDEWGVNPSRWPDHLFQARPLRRYVEQS